MKFTGIIPARYASSRFPGKPLAMLGGKPVIQRVYEQVAAVLDDAYVATDDERIFDRVTAFGGKAVMTRTDHKSGTDRIEEAVEKLGCTADVKKDDWSLASSIERNFGDVVPKSVREVRNAVEAAGGKDD